MYVGSKTVLKTLVSSFKLGFLKWLVSSHKIIVMWKFWSKSRHQSATKTDSMKIENICNMIALFELMKKYRN